MVYGICKLTGQSGKFVRSHLLPKAVTRAPSPNEPRVDGYNGNRPVKRFDSWYDQGIVTRRGEDILSYYDDWAIKELRRLKLVWSSWNGSESLPTEDISESQGSNAVVRQLDCIDGARLRLFYLSLLWRAAVSSLPGYGVTMPISSIERLRNMILFKNHIPLDCFPVVLTQLTTTGPWHNAGPRRMHLPAESPLKEDVPFIRFYFEGLIAHVYEDETGEVASMLGDLAIGSSNRIVVMARPFEGSAQDDWLKEVLLNNLADHSETVERIFGRGKNSRTDDD